MGEVQARSTGAVIPFPHPANRPSRPALRSDEPRGEILLFTGVRYERYDTTPHADRPRRRS